MKKIFYAFFSICLAIAATNAQTTTGRIVGTVADSNGATVSGATVVVTDNQTNKERTTTTNGEGSFLFQLLDVGTYTVKISQNGFKTTTATVVIQVGQEYSLPIKLEIGTVGETVSVTAGADIVNSTNAELSSTLNNRQITELPLATRNPLALILTQAGSASNPSQGTSINGSRTSSTNISRDGINIQDNFIRSNATDFAPGRPSVDNVEEFTLTSQSSVDTGFGGAQINFVTPRGGNTFNGGAWIYNRNSAFGTNSFFSNAAGNYGPNDSAVLSGFRKAGEEVNPRPFRNRNQYGFKLKGPILKDKLFFFVFGERLKDIVTASRLITVLTPTARQGIFRYSSGGTVYSASIFAPGAATAGAPTAINGTAQSLFIANMPAGNSFEVGDGLNTMGARYFQKADSNRDNLTSRLDYDYNSSNNFSAVIDYNLEQNLRNDVDTYNVTPLVLQPARNVTMSAGWRTSPTATFSNELRIGRFFSNPDFLRTDTIPSVYYVPTLVSNAQVTFQQQGRRVGTNNLQDTATWTLGDHSVRFGGQFQTVKINSFNDASVIPTYNLGINTNTPQINTATGGLATIAGGPALTTTQVTAAGNLLALLGGIVSSGNQTFNATSQTSGFVNRATARRLHSYKAFAPYVNDSWRVTPELTLTGGLRYDYYTALKLENGLGIEPIIASGQSPVEAVLNPAGTYGFLGTNSGKANTYYKPDRNNVSYSVGFAYAPKDFDNGLLKTLTGKGFVIRGGLRTSYFNDELVTAPNNAIAGNAGLTQNIAALTSGGLTTLNDRLGSPFNASITVPTFVNSRSYTTNNTSSFNSFGTVFLVDPNLKTPKQTDYTLGIQRKFGNYAFEARYVGSYSKNVLRTIDYNQIKLTSTYLNDFNVARANIVANCATQATCQAGTTLFPTFSSLLTNATIRTLIVQGQAAELINTYLQNGLIPNSNVTPVPAGDLRSQFLANPNTGVANVLGNGGKYFYNSGQFEIRREFKDGFYLQANYTFSKELTDAIGTGQTRVEPFLDNNNPSFDYTRADYDQTHIFNINAIYELPFGKNRRFLNNNKFLDYVIGGWQLGLVWRIASGAPITFTDARGTLNRTGRSARQTALTNLTSKELSKLVGVYKTRCGIYFIDPSRININQAALAAGNCSALNTGAPTGTVAGAASSGFGSPLFSTQIFFNNGPGRTSGLRRAVVNGPWSASADISLLKNFAITERVKFQVRAEAYNLTNSPFFAPGQFIDINSSTFGKVTGLAVGARVVQFAGRLNF